MDRIDQAGVGGWLHMPQESPRLALALTHGAGSNCEAPLLKAVAEAFCAAGAVVLRYDLPFRRLRPTGPPIGSQVKDQDGVRSAVAFLLERTGSVPLVLAGHSYGGRQTSIAASQDDQLADALMLLSYPLHPPGKPEQLRTAHFPDLRIPTLFVHGTKDEFGTVQEMQTALALLSCRHELLVVEGARHGLPAKLAQSLPESMDRFHKIA